MCRYSAEGGHRTPWHFAHLGGMILRGPGIRSHGREPPKGASRPKTKGSGKTPKLSHLDASSNSRTAKIRKLASSRTRAERLAGAPG